MLLIPQDHLYCDSSGAANMTNPLLVRTVEEIYVKKCISIACDCLIAFASSSAKKEGAEATEKRGMHIKNLFLGVVECSRKSGQEDSESIYSLNNTMNGSLFLE